MKHQRVCNEVEERGEKGQRKKKTVAGERLAGVYRIKLIKLRAGPGYRITMMTAFTSVPKTGQGKGQAPQGGSIATTSTQLKLTI